MPIGREFIMGLSLSDMRLSALPGVESVGFIAVEGASLFPLSLTVYVHMKDGASPLPVLDMLAESFGDDYRVKRVARNDRPGSVYRVRNASCETVEIEILCG